MVMNYIDNELRQIDEMTGDDFEIYMTNLLQRVGFHKMVHTPMVNDHGLDAYGYDKKGRRIGFQFKRYNKNTEKVPYLAVYETLGGGRIYHSQINILLTNSFYTDNTVNICHAINKGDPKHPILLWNRYKLRKLIAKDYKIRQLNKQKELEANHKAKVAKHSKHLKAIKQNKKFSKIISLFTHLGFSIKYPKVNSHLDIIVHNDHDFNTPIHIGFKFVGTKPEALINAIKNFKSAPADTLNKIYLVTDGLVTNKFIKQFKEYQPSSDATLCTCFDFQSILTAYNKLNLKFINKYILKKSITSKSNIKNNSKQQRSNNTSSASALASSQATSSSTNTSRSASSHVSSVQSNNSSSNSIQNNTLTKSLSSTEKHKQHLNAVVKHINHLVLTASKKGLIPTRKERKLQNKHKIKEIKSKAHIYVSHNMFHPNLFYNEKLYKRFIKDVITLFKKHGYLFHKNDTYFVGFNLDNTKAPCLIIKFMFGLSQLYGFSYFTLSNTIETMEKRWYHNEKLILITNGTFTIKNFRNLAKHHVELRDYNLLYLERIINNKSSLDTLLSEELNPIPLFLKKHINGNIANQTYWSLLSISFVAKKLTNLIKTGYKISIPNTDKFPIYNKYPIDFLGCKDNQDLNLGIKFLLRSNKDMVITNQHCNKVYHRISPNFRYLHHVIFITNALFDNDCKESSKLSFIDNSN